MDKRCVPLQCIDDAYRYKKYVNYYINSYINTLNDKHRHYCTYLASSIHILRNHISKRLSINYNANYECINRYDSVTLIGIKQIEEELYHDDISSITSKHNNPQTKKQLVYVYLTTLSAVELIHPHKRIFSIARKILYKNAEKVDCIIYRLIYRVYNSNVVCTKTTDDFIEVLETINITLNVLSAYKNNVLHKLSV